MRYKDKIVFWACMGLLALCTLAGAVITAIGIILLFG